MFYTNRELKVHTQFDAKRRSYYGVYLGWNPIQQKSQRFLTTPRRNDGKIHSGFHDDLTVGKTQTGNTRLCSELDDKLYLFMSSRLTDDMGRIGRIYRPKKQSIEIILTAQTHKEPNPCLGWSDCIVKAKVGDMFYVTWQQPDSPFGRNILYYVSRPDRILQCNQTAIEDAIKSWNLRLQDLPFTVEKDEYGASRLRLAEWREIL